MSDVRTPGRAASICAVTLVALLALAAAAGWAVGPPGRVAAPDGMTLALAVGSTPMGLFILHSRPRHRVGRLLLGVGVLALVALAAAAWSGWLPAAWATQWTWWPPLVLIPLALAAFPDADPRSGPLRWVPAVLLGAGTGVAACLAIAAALAPRTLVTTDQAVPAARPWLASAVALMVVVAVGTIVVVLDMVRRARAARDERRSQILCLLPSGILLLIGAVADAAGVPFAMMPGIVALPVGMGVAILRHRVADLDLAVNRTLVWIVMSVAVAATFAVVVGLVSGTALGGSPLVATAIGTGLVAAGFDPLRRLLQRLIGRALFGQRDNPQGILTELGHRMQLASDAGEMLTQLVRTLAGALQLPHVRMLVDSPGGGRDVVAEHGRPQAGPVSFPLVAHGETVGALEVAPRRPGEALTVAETRLLTQIAGQAAIAARAHRLTLELVRARERLVRAREEERLRLRRDLHDGLGPALAGTRMQLSVVRSRLGESGAGGPLDVALDVLADCTREVRRLVDGLRPAALDQGLDAALRQRADALFPGGGCVIEVRGSVVDLPAAVEVAAYRIATEALTNVVTHARASSCRVEVVRAERWLHLAVADDGRGGVRDRDGGVGMDSMRARAAEIGGRFGVDSSGVGTRVTASLPLGRT